MTLGNKRSIRGPSTLRHPSEIQQLGVSFVSPRVFHNNLSAKTLKTKTTTTLYGSASAPSRRSYKGSWRRTGPAVSPTVSHMLQSSMLCHPCSLIFPGISRSINVTKRLAAKRCSYTDMLKRNRAFLSKADLEPPHCYRQGTHPSPNESKDWCTVHAWGPPSTVCSLWPGCFRQSWYATADYYAAMQGCCNQQVVGGLSLVV